jgi:hypothetical protein
VLLLFVVMTCKWLINPFTKANSVHNHTYTFYDPPNLISVSSKENSERTPEAVEFKLLSLLCEEC